MISVQHKNLKVINKKFHEWNSFSKKFVKLKNGKFESRDNEILVSEGLIKNGYRHGLWTYYFKNGKISSKEKFKNGKLHGKIEWFDYDSGELSEEGKYENGKKHGVFKTYFDEGRIIKKVTFEDDFEMNTEIEYLGH